MSVDDDDWFHDMFSQYMVHTCRNISMTSGEDFRSWETEKLRKVADGGGFDLYLFMEPVEFASMKKRQRYPRSQYFCIGARRNAGICRSAAICGDCQ